MKNLITLLFGIVVNFCHTQIINIPDANLKTILSLSNTTTYKFAKNFSDLWIQIDTNGDGEVQVSEAVLVKEIYFKNQIPSPSSSWTVHDITGLESFSNLEYLNTSYNFFNSPVDFSSLISLKQLQISNGGISAVNVSGLSSLEFFGCTVNNLTSIDISELTNLKTIFCGTNQIQELNLNNNTQLSILGCSYNQISTLDISNNPLVTKLACSNNNLTSLNIKNGINHNFITPGYNDCWKTGNANLITICVDASEIASVQNYLNSCDTATPTPVITSINCGLANDQFVTNEIELFPNPSSGLFTILFQDNINEAKIKVFSALGQELFNDNIIQCKEKTIDLESFTCGMYLLQIINQENIYSKILIKK